MKKELDDLCNALPALKYLNFKFKKDPIYDYNLIEWFADGGELRSFTGKITKIKTYYPIYLYKKGLKLYIGNVYENCNDRTEESKLVNVYISYFWNINKNLNYCPRFDLKSLEEIKGESNVISSTETTITYYDGSIGQIFQFSKDKNLKSFEKNKSKLLNILNNL